MIRTPRGDGSEVPRSPQSPGQWGRALGGAAGHWAGRGARWVEVARRWPRPGAAVDRDSLSCCWRGTGSQEDRQVGVGREEGTALKALRAGLPGPLGGLAVQRGWDSASLVLNHRWGLRLPFGALGATDDLGEPIWRAAAGAPVWPTASRGPELLPPPSETPSRLCRGAEMAPGLPPSCSCAGSGRPGPPDGRGT